MEWEKLGRLITFPVTVPLEVEVGRDPVTGRSFARTLHLGTVIETTATTRQGAIARLEKLVEAVLTKLSAENVA